MLKQWLVNKLQGPVYLDCYTHSRQVYELAKIKSADKVRPDWIAKLPPSIEHPRGDNPNITFPENTMRMCAGVTDLYKNSFYLPMWEDVIIYVGPKGTERYQWKSVTPVTDVTVHAQPQRGTFLPALEYQHLKIHSPWVLDCREDVNFLMLDPFWDGDPYSERPFVPPGTANYKYQGSTNINSFIPRPPIGDKKVVLKYGQPMALIVPLTERKVILRHHLISREDKDRYHRPALAFNAAYYIGRKALMDTEKEEQCPMKSK